jgi:predicted dehydrogenase
MTLRATLASTWLTRKTIDLPDEIPDNPRTPDSSSAGMYLLAHICQLVYQECGSVDPEKVMTTLQNLELFEEKMNNYDSGEIILTSHSGVVSSG